MILEHDAVKIPISLKLPPTSAASPGRRRCSANNRDGLVLDSLQIGVDVILGALEIKDLSVYYTREGDVWTGGAKFNIPEGTPASSRSTSRSGSTDGELTMGSFGFAVPSRGSRCSPTPTSTTSAAALTCTRRSGSSGVDRRWGRSRSTRPTTRSTSTGRSRSRSATAVRRSSRSTASGAVHGEDIANAKLIFQTNGYFEADGDVDVDLGVAEVQGGLKAFADLPAKVFSANVNGDLSIGGASAISVQAVISSLGVAACGSEFGLHAGLSYPWGGTPDASVGTGSCDLSPFEVRPVSVASVAGRSGGTRVAKVATAGGTPFEDIAVTGAGRPPSVVLTSPGGKTVVPVAFGPGAASAGAVALPVARTSTTYVMVRNPGAGSWKLSAAPGSSAITRVRQARGYPAPALHARVSGQGATRRLTYSVTKRPGLSVSFAERAHRVYRILGTARGAHGTLRFTPAAGAAGKRTVYAIVSEGGVARESVPVTSYRAPTPAAPARVRGLHVRRHRRNFAISFGSARGAAYYLLAVRGTDGRHLLRLIRGRRHSLTLPYLGYTDHLTVTVTGVSAFGRHGRPVSAHA